MILEVYQNRIKHKKTSPTKHRIPPSQPNPTQSNPTQSNPTQPNPTKPNRTQPKPYQPTFRYRAYPLTLPAYVRVSNASGIVWTVTLNVI